MSRYDLLHLAEKDPAFVDAEHGVARYENINGNKVSNIQRHAMFFIIANVVRSDFKEPIHSLVVGGPAGEFPGDVLRSVNVVVTKDPAEYKKYVLPYDGVSISSPDESFHVVETCHSLEHLKDVHASVAEFFRVLKVGGYMVNIVPNVLTHRHDLNDLKLGNQCYNEWSPEDCLSSVFQSYINNGKFELIQFNTRNNKLDFDVILKKVRSK